MSKVSNWLISMAGNVIWNMPEWNIPPYPTLEVGIYIGVQVATILNAEMNAGYQSIIWNTRNNFGKPVSAGIYFYHLQTKGFVKTRKMVLLK